MSSVVDTESDVGPIRHPIDNEGLNKYIKENVPSIKLPITVKQFGYGQSNPSYLLTDANLNKYVLRRKPPGKIVSKTAHAVDREYYMLDAVAKASNNQIPVPKVYCLCKDANVIGSEFYIMQFVKGRIFHSPAFPDIPAIDRHAYWDEAISMLARLHAVDASKLILPAELHFPKVSANATRGFYERQVTSLTKVGNAQAEVIDKNTGKPIGPIPHFAEIGAYLNKHRPADDRQRQTIVHGDYKIDNLIYHPTEPKIIGVLDWELCTIGHPLSDLGNLLMPYFMPSPNAPKELGEIAKAGEVFTGFAYAPLLPGLPTKEENIALYTKLAGWNPSDNWKFAEVFAYFRLVVIMHGIAARFAAGNASSAKAGTYGSKYPLLASMAYNAVTETKPHI
ncbi:hypothetical protein CANCADRAFT_75029 [Tortispora caseinolytica NRRL Y-17796]|uniref:Aminoglycoside phosphotransferase domain-containing protein n=1 Tax=Tortispora caseinolytica NRRL Y-17796 TaxID=767744 RepID=A0A1E4TIW8_9ASCO|nr:hypothetical protein CANCADRAFT_75029 [Tortispora caseinolytica NRRL Y-17796]